uniref:Gastrokine 3, pseudogene n=1 Tax=Terrapene triunguis TaxID=2587831 RepID=A0A674IE46_9SAUR
MQFALTQRSTLYFTHLHFISSGPEVDQPLHGHVQTLCKLHSLIQNCFQSVADSTFFFVLKELFATRLFNKRACIVAKMNKDAFPSLEKLTKGTPPPPFLRFSITKTRFRNVAQFGRSIGNLCKGVPTYYAQQDQGGALFFESQGCADAGILGLFGIYLCGNISSC